MLYKKIQGTELYSSAICLGTDVVGSMINEERSFELLNFFEVSGGNFLDSAHIYADWLTEEKSTSEKTAGLSSLLKTRVPASRASWFVAACP